MRSYRLFRHMLTRDTLLIVAGRVYNYAHGMCMLTEWKRRPLTLFKQKNTIRMLCWNQTHPKRTGFACVSRLMNTTMY